ncbi:hypothetical protein UFOVP1138_78 [uncultured Caudovirales phage]|uniref:Uncharacterized protein n=1 Tax=uncultured Caudovirales phage TaxID=2100421 RepID=A0A6J5PTX3_9CAUD|nr:hypothetical protein UFOVP975_42 [uncultured Caudovirales phage]CAB4186325.1 hypothetical protein UFOVP1138_78 [uncultured Caudovirales phage]CAB4204459.1 hypothetical protein UFOVP1394_75 [uncultured Caudovirales phage]
MRDEALEYMPRYKRNTDLAYNQFNTVHVTYQKNRNSVIPEAMEKAYEIAGPKPTIVDKDIKSKEELHKWKFLWDKIYLATMDILCKERGHYA